MTDLDHDRALEAAHQAAFTAGPLTLDVVRNVVTAYLAEAGDGIRRAALEEAAVIAETWFDHHRPQQPKKSRFNIYDIEHWAKSATRLVAEDIRARAMLGLVDEEINKRVRK
jgi:hypothetical protein